MKIPWQEPAGKAARAARRTKARRIPVAGSQMSWCEKSVIDTRRAE
jgi:hypothetical protein